MASSNLNVCQRFLELERRLDLFQPTIQHARFWEYCRFYIFLELQRLLGLGQLPPFVPANRLRTWLRRLLSSSAGLLEHNPFVTGPKDLLFFGCPRRTQDEHGIWWDTCVDPYLEHLPYSYYYIERYNHDRHHTPARTRFLKYHDLLTMLACGYRLLHFREEFSREEFRLLDEVRAAMRVEFGVDVDITGVVLPILQTRRCLLSMYQRLFAMVQPRAVFFASINYPERIAIEVCKRLGIPTLELQHGVIGPTDLCYVFPPNVDLRFNPDYLLVFGRFWKDCIEFPLAPEQIIPIGYPYLEAKRAQYQHTPSGDEIVFLSQPTIGKELSATAATLARHPAFRGRVTYRVHPYEVNWMERYPRFKEQGITVSTAEQEPLYDVLARSRAQVGVHSAAIFEGLAFGLETYLLDLPGVENLQRVIDQRLARKVAVGEVEPMLSLTAGPRQPHQMAAFFEPDGLSKFAGVVEHLLASNRSLRRAG